jgi:SAM-dependent methyltransferase
LNVVPGRLVDYAADARKRLPFGTGSFDLIYASHILEHVPWYETLKVLREWVRILKPGGTLEIWIPDGLKIARAFVEAEQNNLKDYALDGWWRFNETRDPCVWMSGRCFSYGDGTGRQNDPNWHHALFSERYLTDLFREAGLVDIRTMRPDEVRGYDHGWINLGVQGRKPAAEAPRADSVNELRTAPTRMRAGSGR